MNRHPHGSESYHVHMYLPQHGVTTGKIFLPSMGPKSATTQMNLSQYVGSRGERTPSGHYYMKIQRPRGRQMSALAPYTGNTMPRDEAAVAAVTATLPTVLQKVTHLKRDIQIAAELLTEPVFTEGTRTRCFPLYSWAREVGLCSPEGYTGAVRLYQRVVGEKNCRASTAPCRVRVVTLRYVTEVLYGAHSLDQHKFGTLSYKPGYEDGFAIDYPPLDLTYEEYINEWKL